MVLGAGTYGDHRLQVKLRVVLSGRSAACTGAEGRCQYKAVHSQYKYVDQSMENWQVSGGGEYWFRCIPSRLGCICNFSDLKNAENRPSYNSRELYNKSTVQCSQLLRHWTRASPSARSTAAAAARGASRCCEARCQHAFRLKVCSFYGRRR